MKKIIERQCDFYFGILNNSIDFFHYSIENIFFNENETDAKQIIIEVINILSNILKFIVFFFVNCFVLKNLSFFLIVDFENNFLFENL